MIKQIVCVYGILKQYIFLKKQIQQWTGMGRLHSQKINLAVEGPKEKRKMSVKTSCLMETDIEVLEIWKVPQRK